MANPENKDRSFLTQCLCLISMIGFAIAEPIYAAIGKEGTYFLKHQLTLQDDWLIMLTLSVALPAFFCLLLFQLYRKGDRQCQDRFFHALLCLLMILFSLPLLKGYGWPIFGQLLVASVMGTAILWLFRRLEFLRLALVYLAFTAVIFPAIFLLHCMDQNPAHAAKTVVKVQTPVVLIIFDELPLVSLLDENNKIDDTRYPAFASLAKGSTWFRNAVTVHNYTIGAVPAIMTGNYPSTAKTANGTECLNPPPLYKNFPDNLFTLLGSSYRLNAFESYLYLCPPELCGEDADSAGRTTVQQKLNILKLVGRNYLSEILFNRADFNEFYESFRRSQVPENKLSAYHWQDMALLDGFLQSFRKPNPDRSLYFFHPLLPHWQWEFYPSGKRYMLDSYIDLEIKNCDTTRSPLCRNPAINNALYKRHLLQVGYVDHVLNDILTSLKKTGLYDRALVIVTADHGISFRADTFKREVSDENFADIMRVPLFVKIPGQNQGRNDTRSVQTIDILPTILDVLKVQKPAAMDGQSLLSGHYQEKTALSICASEKLRAFTPVRIQTASAVSLAKKIQTFGTHDPLRLFAPGPYGGLFGHAVSAAPAVSSLRYELYNLHNLHQADLSSPVLPLRIQGKILAGKKANLDNLTLAIAVNGTISALTQPFYVENQNGYIFSALVPESALKNGDNNVRLYAVEGNPQQPQIRLLFPVTE